MTKQQFETREDMAPAQRAAWRAPKIERFAAGAAEFGFDTIPEGQTGLS
jgi:hypothetical protein